jgi:hypothetical protein
VEFRLLYEGELLPSAGTKKRASEKHAIRRAFHPQLRRLWNINKSLCNLAVNVAANAHSASLGFAFMPDEQRVQSGFKAIGQRWERNGFHFVPLVTEDMVLQCQINILLLRPEEKRYVFEQGDLDGQLKTLVDALRIPKELNETGGMLPQEDEDPFFVLLEDDRLISEVRVTSDQMLLLPNTKEVKANDAYALIHVRLNHRDARTFDNYFG